MLRLRGARSGVLMQQIGRLFLEGTSIGSSEGELLDRFVKARDEAAFEALVARHGPMVLGVCRQLLRDPNDVDDAFQATFLVLVRKAATLRRCDLLGNWLYGVAYRVAMRARSQAARRMGRFGSSAEIEKLAASEDLQGSESTPAASLAAREREPWVHQEVSYLPEKYRTPIVLCYFEGLTHDEAASRLGCPLGTVKGRLSRARDLLRRRLIRRGVALSAAALVSELTAPHAQAAVPAALELATTRAAISLVSSAGASLAWGSSISIPVTALAEGVLHTMIWNQVKITAASLVLAGTIATGVVVGATQLTGGAGERGETQVAVQRSKAAARQSGKTPSKAAVAAKDNSPKSAPSSDMQSQVAATNLKFDLMLSGLQSPINESIDRLSRWSRLMLSAELVVASNDHEKVAARTAHRDRMRKLHEAIKTLPASAENQTVNAQLAQEKLHEAENLLETGENPGSAGGMMANMMQGQMGGMMGGMGAAGRGRGMMGGMMMGGVPKGRSMVRPATEGGGSASAGGAFGGGALGDAGAASEHGASGGAGGSQAGSIGMPGGMGGGMAGMGGAMGGGRGGRAGRALSIDTTRMATELAIRDKNPKSKLIYKSLDEPISMSFNEETPLEDVLKYIKQATTTEKYQGIQIYLDPEGLKETDTTAVSTVRNMDLEGVPLKTTLRLLLRQLGLAYCVRDGVVMISTPEIIFEELRDAQQELETAGEIPESDRNPAQK